MKNIRYLKKYFVLNTSILLYGCATSPSHTTATLRDFSPAEPMTKISDNAVQTRVPTEVNWEQFFKLPPNDEQRKKLQLKINTEKGQIVSKEELAARARVEISLGLLEKAQSHLEQALSFSPKDLSLLIDLGELSLQRDRIEMAVDALEQARTVLEQTEKPQAELVFRYRYVLALCFQSQKLFRQSNEILTDLIAKNKSFAPGYAALALNYLNQQRPDIAEFIVQRGIDRVKTPQASLYNALGLSYRAQGQVTKSKAAFEQALAIQPTHVPSLVNMASILASQGEFDAAEQSLIRAISLSPSHSRAHLALGVCLRAMGQMDRARAEFEYAIFLNPQNAESRFALAQLLDRNFKDRDAAVAQFHEVARLDQGELGKTAQLYINDLLARGG